MPELKHASDVSASTVSGGTSTLFDVDFQERLRTAMTHCSVTPQQLADNLGVSYQAVRQALEGSTKAMTAANTAKTARFLGVDIFWLATGEGQMTTATEDGQMALTTEERDLIVALRVLLPSDREEIIATIIERARTRVARLDAVIARQEARQTASVLKLHSNNKP